MPWIVSKKGKEFCVVMLGGKDSMKEDSCYPTKQAARARMDKLNGSGDGASSWQEIARSFSAKERKQAAAKKHAMPNGSFPVQSAEDLKNAIKLVGRAKDPAAAKAHIIARAKALHLTNLLPKDWNVDGAHLLDGALIACPEVDCDRAFLTLESFADHADAVHTFDDLRMMVSEAIREKYGNKTDNYTSSIYTYVVDIADDWVVFEASQGSLTDFYKCSYSVIDNVATLGAITEVRRRTLWEAVGANEPAGILSDS